jgi:hypothetical protein
MRSRLLRLLPQIYVLAIAALGVAATTSSFVINRQASPFGM